MNEPQERGFWQKLFYGPQPVAGQSVIRQGSVGSAGGDSPLPGIVPPSLGPSAKVTVEQAMSIASVYRAVSIITTTVSQLPVDVFRNGEEITPGAANGNGWLRQPNPDISRTAFLHQTVHSMATRGNAYWRIYGVNAPGDPVQGLEVLNPDAVNIRYENGRRLYEYSGYQGGTKMFQTYQIKHLKLTEVPGSDFGIGPIQACQTELAGLLDLRDYSHSIFKTGLFPMGFVSTKFDVGDKAVTKAIQDSITEMINYKRIGVLPESTKYEPNIFDPVAAQFIENQQFAITQVARMFGIPASKLLAEVNGNSMTYTNMEAVNTEYVQDTLMAYVKPIEEALTDLTARGQTVKLKVDALLRADTATRYSALATATWLTDNEKRALDDYPPLPGGDELSKATPNPQKETNTQTND